MPEYKDFAKELKELCKKYGVRIVANDGGLVGIGPADQRTLGSLHYNAFRANPNEVELTDGTEPDIFV